jgi:rsbT co-antagonist protein RsbR
MSDAAVPRIAGLLTAERDALLADWTSEQVRAASRTGSISEHDLRAHGAVFLDALARALGSGWHGVDSPGMSQVRDVLSEVSRTRAHQGFTPSETAMFVFSLKRPVYARLRSAVGNDAGAMADAAWTVSEVLDALGLFTTEVYQRGREEVIMRQQQDMLELSTPVVSLWHGILALPLIGTLDSARTQVVMETLLQRIVETGADIAIIDITGVPTVDTLTAQHLIKTVTAARLMGADCVISGIRPQIAQTIVHLGVDLAGITTKASLADAFRFALTRLGASIAVRPGAVRPA